MIYNSGLITNGMTQEMPPASTVGLQTIQDAVLATENADNFNPSSKTIAVEADGENTGFTRCYEFDFWIPIYIGFADNPYHIDMTTVNNSNTKITASKYISDSTTGTATMKVVTAVKDVLMRLGEGSIMDEFHTSIII